MIPNLTCISRTRRRTTTGKSYDVEQLRVNVPMAAALESAYRPEECMRSCRACPNFGKIWTCPPFDDGRSDVHPDSFSELDLYIARMVPVGGPYPLECYDEFFIPEKRRMTSIVDGISGAAARYSFAGKCEYCNVCTRPSKVVCRNPDMAHPSLEGVGFDVNALLTDFVGLGLEWGKDGYLPKVLTFVAAVAR